LTFVKLQEGNRMNARLQSASTKTTAKARPAKKVAGESRTADVSELLMAELSARRARLKELLGLIRVEAAREMGSRRGGASRPACRPVPALRVRGKDALRAARAAN
jgi:hypothetical protein